MRGRDRLLLGAVAGASASAVMMFLRVLSPTPSVAEYVQDFIVQLLPGEVFAFMLERVGFIGRPLLFASIVLGHILVGAGLGSLFTRLRPVRQIGPGTVISEIVGLAFGLWLVVGLVVLPLLGGGAFGQNRTTDGLPVSLVLLVVVSAYAIVLVGLYRSITQPVGADLIDDATRRQLLTGLGTATVVAAVAGFASRQTVTSSSVAAGPDRPPTTATTTPPPAEFAGVSPEITPVGRFYTVSKNFIDPQVSADGWTLRIAGQVDQEHEYTYEQLQAMPLTSMPATLCCISNEVGGDLIGNGVWKGVPLRDLIEAAGPRNGVVKVAFQCRDDYTDSITFDTAMNDGALLALEMNGETLAPQHGYPARLVVPGIYGMKNVKWVETITLLETDFLGFWQEQGWNDAAPYQTMSRIDTTSRSQDWVRGTTVNVGGIAFAGNRGIDALEISLDGGITWQRANLKPPLGQNSWVLWAIPWKVDGDRATIQARAIDGTGEPQTAEVNPPFPDGSTGLHTITIRVADA
ncbi:MAG TPA: molybdopterin-dependent oxidoreductase [Chloroflexota bacterium]|nr:molybdopterin-dependent oxidoreductase [Chloroflexota bacterium]